MLRVSVQLNTSLTQTLCVSVCICLSVQMHLPQCILEMQLTLHIKSDIAADTLFDLRDNKIILPHAHTSLTFLYLII